MKLVKFVAENTQKAMQKVQAALGPEALVYSTQKITGGVEMLVLSAEEQNNAVEHGNEIVHSLQLYEKFNSQLQLMNYSIQTLSTHVNMLQQAVTQAMTKKKPVRHSLLLLLIRVKKYLTEGKYAKQPAN